MTDHTTTPLVDTRQMTAVHTFFRREVTLAPAAVRAVPAGEVKRARVVADHLDYVGRCLHGHHVAEDELAWPLLLERVPEELAPIVELMQAQHERLDALLHEAASATDRWRLDAAEVTRDRLAVIYDALAVTLVEHLDAEEQRLLPIAARTLSPAEWHAIGEHARSHGRSSEKVLTFGMIQADGDPEVVAGMLAGAPAPVRWALPTLARRAYRRRAVAVHGTATP